jgi:hypothetical protein
MMKYRAFILITVLFGGNFTPLAVRADFGALANDGRLISQGKDVSAAPWKSTDAGNLYNLAPRDDSTNSITLKGFSECHLDSLFGTNSSLAGGSLHGANMKVEITKPIEKVEPRNENPAFDPQPVPIAPRKSDGRRVLLIALSSVAILAYRKLRRPHTRGPSQKPSFL